MLQDISNLPITGGAVLASAAYAALSLFVTGPLVAERMIEKSGWAQHCARSGKTVATPSLSPSVPRLDCTTVLGALHGREGAAYCVRYGQMLSLPLGYLDALAAQPAEASRRRAAERGNREESTCGCAIATVVETRRYDFALHAGSARFITPMPVRTLAAELDRARSSACSVKG